jgi:hypothetical protein
LRLKRLISIGLLTVLLYNTVGYHAYFLLRQRQARDQVRTLLDARIPSANRNDGLGGIQQGNWVVFRIPLQLYHQPNRQPIPVEGEFEYQNKIYEKALMGIENDTVLLYCVNNKGQEKVRRQLSDHAKALAADFPTDRSDKAQKMPDSFLKEYLSVVGLSFSFRPWRAKHAFGCCATPFFNSLSRQIPHPPPRQS